MNDLSSLLPSVSPFLTIITLLSELTHFIKYSLKRLSLWHFLEIPCWRLSYHMSYRRRTHAYSRYQNR